MWAQSSRRMASRDVAFYILLIALSLVVAKSAAAKELQSERKLPLLSHLLSVDKNADPRCLRGFRSPNGRRICCSRGCSKCGGTGCNRGGNAKFCCGKAIIRSNRSCESVGAPCVALSGFPSAKTPDPTCRRGILKSGICCPEGCRFCGGPRCGDRTPPGTPNWSCCIGIWRTRTRACDKVGPPCRVGSVVAPSPKPRPPSNVDKSRWITITDRLRGRPSPRHEACMAWVDGKGYLVGGRGDRPVNIFDPASGTWKKGRGSGFVMHHMQCVGWGGKIWVVSAWTGGFPFEKNVEDVWVYDPPSNSWSTRKGLPSQRLRGGAAAILFDDKVWVIGGNIGGHGDHATTLGWMDYYDLRRDRWVTNLPELPEGRDHVTGALVNGDMLCISGGRDGGKAEFFTATITSTYCYKVSSGSWKNMRAELPAGRGGAMAVTTCDGHMMIVGGERLRGPASSQVDIFDGVRWRTTRRLNQGRHGGGLAVSDCSCGKIFAVSGSGGRGGGPELDSTEMYLPDGSDFTCKTF